MVAVSTALGTTFLRGQEPYRIEELFAVCNVFELMNYIGTERI